jgi:heme-degrading monooxygenase HmoA
VIARIWTAQTTPDQAPAYAEHLRAQVLPALRTLDGYEGALLLERALPGAVDVIVLTFWRSMDSIRGFAGADVEGAMVAEEAAALLTQFDRRVQHYEVPVKDAVSATTMV